MNNFIVKILQLASGNKLIRLLGPVLIFWFTMGIASASGPSISTDNTDYGPNDLVTITGTGFTPGATITLTISVPDVPDGSGTKDTTEVTADGEGKFVLTYQLINGIQDKYLVTAADGINTATTSFTDAGGSIMGQVFGGLKKWIYSIGGKFSTLFSLNPGTSYGVPSSSIQGTSNSEIPEFPTVALPVAITIGLVFLFQYKNGKI